MKKISLSLLLLAIGISMSGCGSMYNYMVKPTPIKEGESKYILRDVDLKLEYGYGRNIENKTYKTEKELENSFKELILKELSEKAMLDNNGFLVDVNIHYKRVYNHGGNSINKPEFYYIVKVYSKDGKLLADYSIGKSTTKYGTFKDIAVNAEIGIFQWDAEDEPQDIALISKTLVKELSELGD